MSENRQIERALNECKGKFSEAFKQSPLALMLTSAEDHRYIEVNEIFERVSGWKRDEVIGRTPFDIGIWVNPGQRIDVVRRLLSEDTVRDLEILVRTREGKVWSGLGSAELIEIDGKQCVLGVVAVTDLMPVKEAERFAERLSNLARRLIQAHDEERAAIARELHDYIERLALLSRDLDRIRQVRPKLSSENGHDVARARQQIEDLVSNIQTLSHRLHYSKLQYLGLTTVAANFCKEFADQKELEISFMSEGIPKELSKEISFCLFHVLREALQNATEHSSSRKFQVSFSVQSGEIHLIVRDLGVGFDLALERSGLSLDLMRERLKLVNGELSIESQRQRVTAIHARVPLNP